MKWATHCEPIFRRLTATVITLIIGATVTAETETVNDITWTYTVSGGYARLGNVGRAVDKSISGPISIPSTLGGFAVVDIGRDAFNGCSNITSVEIPSAVTNIGQAAFQMCTGLSSIVVPAGVRAIGHAAFNGCNGLGSVTIEEGISVIGTCSFQGCSALTSISLPSSVEEIAHAAFYNCSNLKSVTFNCGIKTIGSNAFEKCGEISEITIPKTVVLIGDRAFANTGLSKVLFDGDAPTLNEDVFDDVTFGCRGYIKRDSIGWNTDVPGDWNGLLLCYDDHSPISGTWVVHSEDLLACYQFNGDVDDSSGNAYHLGKDADMNWPVFTTDRFGRNSSAFLFNGQNDMGLKALGEASRAVVSRTFTVSFWFQTTASCSDGGSATSTYKGNFAIFPVHSGNTTSQGLGICVGRDGIRLKGHYAGDLPVLMTYSASIDSSWHQIAVTMLNNGAPEIYLDGRKVATGSTPARTVNVGIRIGGDTYGYYTGKLDDVRIYNRALSAAEIQTLYELVEQPITYENLMGATHSNPEVYTEGGYGTFTPPVEPEGLEFMGWSPSAIASTDHGAVTVRASWGVPVSNDNEKVTVPLDWLDQSGVDLADGYQSAVTNTTGKTDMGGKPMYVWQDYVAGTDPTNMDSRFTAAISMSNDVPYITWSPNLNTNGIVRNYTVLGKTNLTDTVEWAPTNSAHRFFKVKVEMP